MGHDAFRSRHRTKGVDQPLEITTLPLRSAEGVYHPRLRHHPRALCDPLTSEHHAERARPIEQRYRHGGRTDRKASVGPSIDRNSCGGDKTNICEQDIGIQPLRHCSHTHDVQRRGGSKFVNRCDGDAGLEGDTLSAYGSVSVKDELCLEYFHQHLRD
jgi:hypothetical protein